MTAGEKELIKDKGLREHRRVSSFTVMWLAKRISAVETIMVDPPHK